MYLIRRSILLVVLLACFQSIFAQLADKIYSQGKLEIGQIIPPFNVMSTEVEFSGLTGERKVIPISQVDSVYRDDIWYFNLTSFDKSYELKMKLARRFFVGDFSLFENTDELGDVRYFLFKGSRILLLTNDNVKNIFSEQAGNSSFANVKLSKSALTNYAIAYHRDQNLEVKDYIFERKEKPIAFGLALTKVSSKLSGATLVTNYDAGIRFRAFVNFRLKRSQFSLGYTIGQIKYSTVKIATNNGLYQINEGLIKVNGGSVHYDYFLSNKKNASFLRVGFILTEPKIADDERYFFINYSTRSYPFFGAGFRVFGKPEIILQYNYRSKEGEYRFSAFETFKETNHSFGLELSF